MNKKVFLEHWIDWTIAIIIMVFIVVWGAVQRFSIEQEYSFTGDDIYYSVRLHKKAAPSTVDTSNWKTYRNEKNGFEIKYPTNLPEDISNAPTAFARYLNIDIQNKPANFKDLETYVKALAAREQLEGNETSATGINVSVKKTTAGSEPAFEKAIVGFDAPGNTTVDFYVERGNQLFVLSLGYQANVIKSNETDSYTTEAKKNYEITRGILSTFQFIR